MNHTQPRQKLSSILQATLASVVVIGCVAFSHPVAAAAWGECATEQGTTIIPNGSPTATVSPITPITNIPGTFVLVQATGANGVISSDRHLVTGEVTGTGQILLTRGGTNNNAQVSYTIVQCSAGDKINVRRGTITIASGFPSNTGGLTSAVDTNRSIVLVTTRTSDTTVSDNYALVTASLLDANNVIVQRSKAAATTVYAHYQVIEFPVDANVQVQTGETTLDPGESTDTVTLSDTVAADRTWVTCSYDATDNGLQQTAVGCALTDAATVTVYRYAASAYTNRVHVYVVTWPEDTVTVLSGTSSVDPTGAADGDPYTDPIAIPAPGADTHHSFSYVTNTVAGTTSGYPRNRWLNTIYDNGTLRTSFWRTDTAGSSDATVKYWQVINFPTPYHATGWGWIGNSADSPGEGVALVSFDCDNVETNTTGPYVGSICGNGTAGTLYDYGVELEHGGCGDTCDVTGQAWVGSYNDGEAGTTIGMIDFNPDVTSGPPVTQGDNTIITPEDDRLDAHWNEETGELYGWARFRALEDYEDTLGGTANDWGWIKLRGAESTGGVEYGVQFDADALALSDWGWNDNGTEPGGTTAENGSGFGWVKFDLNTSGTVADAWLRTTQADVYSQQGFNMSTSAPSGEYNATYRILTNGSITRFDPNPTLGDTTTEDLGGIPTDNSSQVFRGDLGSIYVNELIDQADYTDTSGGCDASLFTNHTNPLGGSIFYCAGDLTIDSNLTFYNGTSTANGSGTVVVGGNLYINDKLNYFNNAIDQHINNLASVAWIVQGSVFIDPVATDVVGAFIVLGDADFADDGLYNDTAFDFNTGDSILPLELNGLVMARSFDLQRVSKGTTSNPEPAEDFRYDGRVLANPPPGLADLASLLPEYQ